MTDVKQCRIGNHDKTLELNDIPCNEEDEYVEEFDNDQNKSDYPTVNINEQEYNVLREHYKLSVLYKLLLKKLHPFLTIPYIE